jgi:hypothetical protein
VTGGEAATLSPTDPPGKIEMTLFRHLDVVGAISRQPARRAGVAAAKWLYLQQDCTNGFASKEALFAAVAVRIM